MPVIRLHTTYSVYEVDMENKQVRRMLGLNTHTDRQGPDGQWQTFETCWMMDGGMVFKWGTNADGSDRCTWTSHVVQVEEVKTDVEEAAGGTSS